MGLIDPKPRELWKHPPSDGILNNQEERIEFQNIHRFLNRTDVERDAKIDRVHFFNKKQPLFEPDFHHRLRSNAACLADVLQGRDEAEVFIIEGVDPDCLRQFLAARVKNDVQRRSFLRFVEEYLHDQPSFNFTDVEYRIPPPPSVQAKQQHEVLVHIHLREFDRHFKMSYADIQESARKGRGLRGVYAYGPQNPVQRPASGTETGDFPPLAITRAGVAVWFGGEPGEPWHTGLILADKRVPFRGLPGQTRPSRYVVGGQVYVGHTSLSSLLMDCFQRNVHISKSGIPAPFTITQDIHSIIGYDWIKMTGFITRDLNSIHWALQGGDFMSAKYNQELYRTALEQLFSTHRRLVWYCELIQIQLDSCRSKGRPSWNDGSLEPEQVEVADLVSKELVMDFENIKAQVMQTAERLDKTISHVNGQLNIQEVERANAQSKIVLALAVVGGFFLPISTIAAIFSMADDWAPGKDGFGQFWAICIPISALVMMILVMIIRWPTIVRWVGRIRRVRQTGMDIAV